MVALAEERQEGGRDGPHARGADEGRLAALELRKLLGELGRIGVAVARVDEATRVPAVQGVDMIEIIQAVNDAQVEGGDRAAGWSTRQVRGCGRRGSRYDPREGSSLT